MICENCQTSVATIHLSGWQMVGTGTAEEQRQGIDYHFCEECAHRLKQSNPFLNPLLRAGPSARIVKLRVVSVSGDRTVVRQIYPESETAMGDLVFLTSRLPSGFAEVGMQFEVACTNEDFEWLRGKG